MEAGRSQRRRGKGGHERHLYPETKRKGAVVSVRQGHDKWPRYFL